GQGYVSARHLRYVRLIRAGLPRASRAAQRLAWNGARTKNVECGARRGYSRSSRERASRIRGLHQRATVRDCEWSRTPAAKCFADTTWQEASRVSRFPALPANLAPQKQRAERSGALL